MAHPTVPVRPAAEQVQALADAVDSARTVTLFCGAGCRDAHAEVMELAGKLLAPVGHALGGKEWVQYDNPFDVGMNGLLGYGAAHKATHEADLLLLGTDFPYTNFLPQRHTAQVDADAVFTVDTGMCNVWAARYLTPNGRRRVIGSFRHGSMANALPHAVGASFAAPGRQVVSMSGDGGLAMLLGELITVRLHRLPVKVVLFNNASLGMVKLEMMVDGIPDFETDHEPTDFAAIAEGVGIRAMRVEDPRDVRDTLAKGLADPGPVLMEFVTDPNALSIPPAITGEQVRGFARSASRMVLGGSVGKMVDLARSNLRNIPRP